MVPDLPDQHREAAILPNPSCYVSVKRFVEAETRSDSGPGRYPVNSVCTELLSASFREKIFLEQQHNPIKLWGTSTSIPKRIVTISEMEQTRRDYSVPPCFYLRSPARSITVLRDLLMVDHGTVTKDQTEFHSRYSLPDIHLTEEEKALWDTHDRQCLTYYLTHEELSWWYLNATNAGAYPEGHPRSEDFLTFVEAWKTATTKWNKGRKRSRGLEDPPSPLPHYPTHEVVVFFRGQAVRKTLALTYTRNSDPPRVRRFTMQRPNEVMIAASDGSPLPCPWPDHGRRHQIVVQRPAPPRRSDLRIS
jgi:hypothetical protein